jgi:hypothetical protein
MAADRCPHCRRGTRVEHVYEIGGVVHDASYCGVCGKNFPPPPRKEPQRDGPLESV